ncbi:MAG: serine/threonine-protein phosphatase, partial [Calditrichaeota bacterium]|nr:serine/threonine-protein phosphatase [Calditrichota bacterium]
PALEVGGDYYDFVELEGNRLGVVIGDVSGKGTQAAFYMTLTKGFWRALANASDSPAEVLTKLNKLFYDNVKRGVFISMVYGIFDLESGILTLARAGHNPVVMHKGQELNMERIHPRGLALGMEKGVRFGQVIQEVKIPFQIGDLFIFYTDGFTEAMDKNKREYGEERFEAAILNNSQGAAETVMNAVFKDVKLFAGKAEQHDDMTIVVVKIGESGVTRPDPASIPAPHAAPPPDSP